MQPSAGCAGTCSSPLVSSLKHSPSQELQSVLRLNISHALNHHTAKHRDQALWKWNLLQPALAHPKHSRARGQALRRLAQVAHARPDGRHTPVSLDSLYTWLSSYEQQGLLALMRRPRRDTGRRLVQVTRRWDKACTLPAEVQSSLAEQLAEHVRSLWAAGAPGYRTVADLGSAFLHEISRAAGWVDVALSDCQLSRSYVERYRRYALLAMHDKDARQFFDTRVPRIRRHRDGLQPMDIVVGDVHPIDILLTRADGSTVTPRAICWLDVATQRLHVTLVQLEKSEGIKQAHVAQSFMALCSAWGLPRQLYLDNGAEYGWHEMMDGFAHLSRLTGEPLDTRLMPGSRAVVRARPYNAPAKPIEGLFALLEQQVLSMLPGWIGGNRMRAKTHNVGRRPQPYSGDWAAFHDSFDRALAYYHARAQLRSRTLQGLSPNDALRMAIELGWSGAPQVEALALQVAFSSEDRRLIQSGGYFSCNGKTYFDDALIAHTGKRLPIRYVKWETRQVFVFDEQQQLICVAQEAPQFAFFGEAGVQAHVRREHMMRRYIQDLRQDTVRLDLEQATQRRTALAPPAPTLPKGPRIELTPALRGILQALQTRASQPDGHPSASSSTSGISQWATPPNPLLAEFGDPADWEDSDCEGER